MTTGMSEAQWELLAIETLIELDWPHLPGDEIAPGNDQRAGWDDLVIAPRLMSALQRLNPTVPLQYLRQAMTAVLAPTSLDALTENHRIHGYLVEGYRGITYIDDDGRDQTPTIRLISSDWSENEWLSVSQVTVVQGDFRRRFDLVLYCNGLPVSILELKKAGSRRADVTMAQAQLRTYLYEFPMAFRFCVFTLVSDGLIAKYGTPFTPLNHFSPWNLDDDGRPVALGDLGEDGDVSTGLEVALHGLYNQERFLQLVFSFTAWDANDQGLAKRIAKPHQYFAVTTAVERTIQAVESNGKAGVVWHTQGSGKSMEMELYTNLVTRQPKLLNPTIVVITDRKELDGQLFESFQQSELLPEKPKQIRRRSELRRELSDRVTGGIYFTTLQKFSRTEAERESGPDHPLLSARRNIIVIVDEAHRSHYDDLDGYAKYLRDALPHATLIAFTGTPLSLEDRNTKEVFGDTIDTYDLTRAVADGATVPVYFEPRLIKVTVAEHVTEEMLDAAADEATLGLDDAERAQVEQAVAVVNAVYGAPERLAALADDIVTHWEQRRRQLGKYIETPGKALIVGGTREICANLYSAIVRLRPDWHSPDLARGRIKVVYSGTASDEPPIRDHVRRDSANKTIKNRLKDPDDELEIVIVKDMMLTGYDSPPLHTLYLDRPLKGALLMQTLARVNRTFRGKPDGLLVTYAPLIDNLKNALAEYTVSDQEKRPVGRSTEEAATLTLGLLELLRALLAGHDWRAILAKGGAKAWLNAAISTVSYLRDPSTPGNQLPEGQPTLAQEYRRLSSQLARAWALCSGSTTLREVQPDAQFYEEVRVWMAKYDAEDRAASGAPVPEEITRLLADVIATSTAAGDVLDIYAAAGMPKPTLGDLNPQFLSQTQQATNPHLAIEALRALIAQESIHVTRQNIIRQRAFSERIAELMAKYTNQQLTSAEVIAELVELAKEVAAEGRRGETFTPPLSHDELAFYDAVAQNESAVLEQGQTILADIARELVAVMRRDVRTDWTVRDDVRAKLRSSIKRLLVKYRYPPDKQPEAIKLVMEQMESMAPRYARDREVHGS